MAAMDLFDPGGLPVRTACRKAAEIAPPVPESKPLSGERLMMAICMTPRSGSSHLGALLRENGFGQSREYFRVAGDAMKKFVAKNDIQDYDGYVRRVIQANTREGIFAVKLGWLQFVPIYYFGYFDAYFRSAKLIYLTRGDLLGQAISRYLGSETGYFHTPLNKAEAHTLQQDVPMDFDKITEHLDYLVNVQAAWEQFFSTEGLTPLRVRYEELSADPAAVLGKIADYVGRPLQGDTKLETEFKKVRNERNERLREAYVAESRRRREVSRSEVLAVLMSSANDATAAV